MRFRSIVFASLLLLAICPGRLSAENSGAYSSPVSAVSGGRLDADTELSKKTQNPVANIITLPSQNNLNYRLGKYDQMGLLLNVQPVIPLHLTEDWNLITRTILPVIEQPYLTTSRTKGGIGDLMESLFLSPAKPGKFIWGLGPVFQFPTATDTMLGTGKWCMGPTLVGLVMPGRWVIGSLVNNIYSVGGDCDRVWVNQMTIQPFVNYNFNKGLALSYAPTITANWRGGENNRWTVPLGLGMSKLFRVGTQPIRFTAAQFYNVSRTKTGALWTTQLTLTFIFSE